MSNEEAVAPEFQPGSIPQPSSHEAPLTGGYERFEQRALTRSTRPWIILSDSRCMLEANLCDPHVSVLWRRRACTSEIRNSDHFL